MANASPNAIKKYYQKKSPKFIREMIKEAKKGQILNPDYPYDARMDKEEYEEAIAALQIELVKFQSWVKATGQRIVIVFEGRDAAGKGGTIKRFRENLNPRVAKVVALGKPSDREAQQWYFQRYIQHLPPKGEITFFDRSWYNRGVVEQVFEFCSPDERSAWLDQVGPFEQMVQQDGTHLTKIWLSVGRATQLKRFLDRESDLLKQWKLSWIDIEGLSRWQEYTESIAETLSKTNHSCPWTVILSDDKRRARLNAIRSVLKQFDYSDRDKAALGEIDSKIAGGVSLLVTADAN